MTDRTQTARRPGRPRDPATDEAILTATLAVLTEDGYGGLSMDRIAEVAGVSKATIYRRWSSRQEVIVAAGEHLSRDAPIPDTGNLRHDLQELVDGLVEVFVRPATHRLVAALVAGMADDEDLATAVRDGFLGARRHAARTVLEQAASRGEIRDNVDLDAAIDLLAAPFYHRLLVTGQTIDDRYGRQVVDAVLAWIRPS
jgi:AcrR family transcriptional regulator